MCPTLAQRHCHPDPCHAYRPDSDVLPISPLSENTPPPHSSADAPVVNRDATADGEVSNVFYNLRVVVHSRSYIQQEVSEGTLTSLMLRESERLGQIAVDGGYNL